MNRKEEFCKKCGKGEKEVNLSNINTDYAFRYYEEGDEPLWLCFECQKAWHEFQREDVRELCGRLKKEFLGKKPHIQV